MKKITKLLLLTLLIPLLWASCSKDNEEEVPLPPVDLVLSIDNSRTIDISEVDYEFEILEGNGGYTAELSDSAIAKVRIEAEKVIVNFLLNGYTQVIISDQEGKTQEISFAANLPALRAGRYQLAMGMEKESIIDLDFGTQEGYYIEGLDPEIIQAKVDGNKITVTSVNPGTDSLTVFDSRGTYMPLKVYVIELFDLTGETLTIETGRNRIFHIKLLWGEDDYTVTSSSSLFNRVYYHKHGHADGTSTIQIDTHPEMYGSGTIRIEDKNNNVAYVTVDVKHPK